jgi:hypothetical protein
MFLRQSVASISLQCVKVTPADSLEKSKCSATLERRQKPGETRNFPPLASIRLQDSAMAEFDRNGDGVPLGSAVSNAEAAAIDAGLRAYMLRIHNYMALGLAITGAAALGIYLVSSPRTRNPPQERCAAVWRRRSAFPTARISPRSATWYSSAR